MHRKSDLQILENIYLRESNDIVLVYGDSFCDADDLIKSFMKNKKGLFYDALCVTEEAQRMIFADHIRQMGKSVFPGNIQNDSVLASFLSIHADEKRVLVINDFQYLLRRNKTYINYLSGELIGSHNQGNLMVILVSKDLHFVNNEMAEIIGKKVYEFSASIHIKPLLFSERYNLLKNIDDDFGKNLISVILGGNEVFYDYDFTGDYKKCILEFVLDDNRAFISYMNNLLPEDIRRKTVYNSILYFLSKKINKLNDLHNALNMDRSKVMIYLNTLVDYGIVEKCESIEAGEKDDTLKGSYRISNSSVNFYYRFLFPNRAQHFMLDRETFFKKYIESGLVSFVSEYYPRICMEQVLMLGEKGRLSFEIEDMGEYHDKTGAIDFIIKVKGGNIICCGTDFGAMYMSSNKLEDIKKSIKRYKIDCDNIWLFSREGFDQKLNMTASINPMVKLITGNIDIFGVRC